MPAQPDRYNLFYINNVDLSPRSTRSGTQHCSKYDNDAKTSTRDMNKHKQIFRGGGGEASKTVSLVGKKVKYEANYPEITISRHCLVICKSVYI